MDDFSVAMPGAGSKTKEQENLESLEFGTTADTGLNFDAGAETPDAGAGKEARWEPEPAPPAPGGEVDLEAAAPGGNGESSAQWDESATKLDLAKAYIDMGDAEGARSILQEVMSEGNEAQKKQAQELSSQIA